MPKKIDILTGETSEVTYSTSCQVYCEGTFSIDANGNGFYGIMHPGIFMENGGTQVKILGDLEAEQPSEEPYKDPIIERLKKEGKLK